MTRYGGDRYDETVYLLEDAVGGYGGAWSDESMTLVQETLRKAKAEALRKAAKTIPDLFCVDAGTLPPGWSLDFSVSRANNVAVKNISMWLFAWAEKVERGD